MDDLDELYKQLEEWRNKRFYNAMNDHWSREDYAFDNECMKKIKELEERIRRLKNE